MRLTSFRRIDWWLAVCVIVAATSAPSSAQRPTAKVPANIPTGLPQVPPQPKSTQTDIQGPAYLDQVIEPETYKVGPGDLIVFNIWSERPEQFEAEISPEATLIIPAVGDLDVRSMTLSQLKEAATTRIRALYPRTPISVTLTKVRRFRVTVTGAVEKPGLHVVTANTRASEVLDQAGLEDDAARRQVRLERYDTTVTVDLAAFERLGIRDANPYLSEGDVLVVPPITSNWGTVEVAGSVNAPGTFGFSPGDLVGDLIDLAFGLTPDADTTRVELWRFPPDGAETKRWEWPAGTSLTQWRLFALQPDDRLFVRAIDGYRPKRSVMVNGEVRRPGKYVFAGEAIALRNVIDSAGGFTASADLVHALVIRYKQPEWVAESRTRLGLIPNDLRAQSESDMLLADALTVQGRVATDFVRLFLMSDESYNIPLYDGDQVVVPRMTESINIIGRVVEPGLIPMKSDADLEYYLERAGGYSWQADRGGTFLVKGATGAAIKRNRIETIEAGDTIVIPTRRGRRWWQAFRETLTVATGLATLYLVVDQVTTN